MVSRKGNDFKSFRTLNESLLQELTFQSAVLDGEIVCLNEEGKPDFRELFLRRGKLCFIAFDLLWFNGQDLTYAPLIERKHQLRAILPKDSDSLLYCDHVERDGESLFRIACENDLEGIVAKRKFDPYLPNQASWLKIRNTKYSQWEGREKLFERERESDPYHSLWEIAPALARMSSREIEGRPSGQECGATLTSRRATRRYSSVPLTFALVRVKVNPQN